MAVIITIDTTNPLTDSDKAVLRALLQESPHTATPGRDTPRRAADLAGVIASNTTRPASSVGAFARMPVANQPGVSFTASTSEDEDTAS